MNSKQLPVPLRKIYLLFIDLRVVVTFYATLVVTALYFVISSQISISPSKISALAAGGFLSVNLLEYLIHRYLFHATRFGNKLKKAILDIHMRHHRYNEVEEYAIVPITTSFVLISLATVVFFSISSGPLIYTLLYFSFMAASYIYHELLHYMIHQKKLSGRFGDFYYEFHGVHHMKDAKKNYCFISPFWDMVFGTYQWRK